MSTPSTVIVTPTIAPDYTPASNCALPTFTLSPLGIDRMTVNTTIHLGRVFIANYTLSLIHI